MELVWVPNAKCRADTIHRAGCAHLSLAAETFPLTAGDAESARVEIADAMGWEDYPDDTSGMGFDIHVSPCVNKQRKDQP